MDKSNWQYNTISNMKITKVENGYIIDLFVKLRKPDPVTKNCAESSQFVFSNGTDTVDFINECLCD